MVKRPGIAALVLVVLALGACGNASNTEDTSAAAPNSSTTIGRPPPPDPDLGRDTNAKNTPLQRLCSARNRVRIVLTDATIAVNDEAKRREKNDELKRLIQELDRSLEADTQGVDRRAAAFRDHFVGQVRAANAAYKDRSDVVEDAGGRFNFEEYPGAQEYVSAAQEEGQCSQP